VFFERYQTHAFNEFGVPLNSRATVGKHSHENKRYRPFSLPFLAALYYGDDGKPSDFSTKLFDGALVTSPPLNERVGYFRWANVTTDRQPISDWTYTDSLSAAGFTNRYPQAPSFLLFKSPLRPVLGAMYAAKCKGHSGLTFSCSAATVPSILPVKKLNVDIFCEVARKTFDLDRFNLNLLITRRIL